HRALPADACMDTRWGYLNFRPEDGERFAADAAADVERVKGQMRAAGLMADRRLNPHVPAGRYSGWALAGYALLAFVAGLAAQTLVGRVVSYAATWGAV